MTVTERECKLKELQALDFKLYDLQLYLDTHPFDEDALCLYQDTADEAMDKREEYESKYGPVTANVAATDCEWLWINNPWPWERMV